MLIVVGLMPGLAQTASAQALTDTANGTLAVVVNFAALTPGTSNAPATTTAQFRIRSKSNTGYNVEVTSVTFVPIASAPVAGGNTVSASDIGIGITAVAPSPT